MNIAIAGQAKSLFVESIDDAENGYFELANKKYNDALQLLEEMKYNSFIKKRKYYKKCNVVFTYAESYSRNRNYSIISIKTY